MSVLAEYETASPNLILCPTLEALPGATFELEDLYALEPNRPVAFVWVRCSDGHRLERALKRDETIDRFEHLGSRGTRRLYRLRRSASNALPASERWVSVGAQLLRAYGVDGRWDVRMRFPDRQAFTTYHAFLEESGATFDLHRLSNDAALSAATADVLTSSQRDALKLAFERGFFDVPRDVTLGELAEELAISDQAVSERLRRGQARLVEEHLF